MDESVVGYMLSQKKMFWEPWYSESLSFLDVAIYDPLQDMVGVVTLAYISRKEAGDCDLHNAVMRWPYRKAVWLSQTVWKRRRKRGEYIRLEGTRVGEGNSAKVE